MIDLIKKHLESYPKMEIQDVMKLLYQSEFGGGHLISNEEMSLKRIQEEYEHMNVEDMVCMSVIEPIGDKMCRIYLSAIANGMKPEVLNQIFVKSANHRTGSVTGLEEKLNQLMQACEQGKLPFEASSVKTVWDEWREEGYPAKSHSVTYREAYHPAYRVIEASYSQIYDVICEVENVDRPFIVGIDGMSSSGKTTMGNLLKLNYPEANLFHMDDYFLQPHQRTAERLAEAGGNVDYERIYEEILSKLLDRNGLTYRAYDCQTQSVGAEQFVPWSPLVFVEGCYSHHPYFGNPYDLRVFAEISAEEQVERIRKRNGEKMLKRFVEEWIPRENQFFKTYKIKEKSGLQ